MGLLDFFKGNRKVSPAAESQPAPQRTANQLVFIKPRGYTQLETYYEDMHADAFPAFFAAIGDNSGGVLMKTAVLVPEPHNTVDEDAVAVYIDGRRVSYLRHDDAVAVGQTVRNVHSSGRLPAVLARVWAKNDFGSWRGRVTLSFDGAAEPEWTYTGREQERRAAAVAQRENIEPGEAGRLLAESDRVSQVRGQHYSQWSEQVQNLKRVERYDEALELLRECIDAAEADARLWHREPAPFWTTQAAIVLRKLKDYDGEVAVLERYLAATPEHLRAERGQVDSVSARLHKARELRDRAIARQASSRERQYKAGEAPAAPAPEE